MRRARMAISVAHMTDIAVLEAASQTHLHLLAIVLCARPDERNDIESCQCPLHRENIFRRCCDQFLTARSTPLVTGCIN